MFYLLKIIVVLKRFKVVIWSNTSGDAGLTSSQKNNYEQYVNAGGGYLGIHAASDTYRHSSANGSNTGSWDFYAENLSGCSVQQSPNHTSSNHNNTMDQVTSHPILANIPNSWNKTEEYYYWENGYVESSFNTLLNVRTTGSNSYDSARMTTQYKTLTSGSRCFYTSLGHAASNFTTLDNDFEILNKNALYWVANPVVTTTINNIRFLPLTLYPNPAKDILYFSKKTFKNATYKVYDSQGKEVLKGFLSGQKLNVSTLNKGLYYLIIKEKSNLWKKSFQVIK